MNTNREKTSTVMGLVVSVLLHGIFLAGCVAIDFTIDQDGSTSAASSTNKTEITKVASHTDMVKMKS